jgi:hypothetical protein
MKKICVFLCVLVMFGMSSYAVNVRDINDTSNIRISSAELRARLLTELLKKKLDLDESTVESLRESNSAFEAKLHQLVIDNPPPAFKKQGKKKEDDKFDIFSKERERELKNILGKAYSNFEKQQYALRNDLKKSILAYNEDQKKKEKARQDSVAAVEAQHKAAELAKAQAAYQKKKALEIGRAHV